MKQTMSCLRGSCLILMFLLLQILQAQSQPSAVRNDEGTMSFQGDYLEKGKVVLRWLPPTAGAWKYLNYYGYRLERAVLDSLRPQQMQWISLAYTIKPQTLEEWKRLASQYPTDTMLMVAGQAVHGQTSGKSMSLENIEYMDDELNNYYTACIFASEFSARAATTAGLRFDDAGVAQNTVYAYRLTPLYSSAAYPLEPVVTIVNTRSIAEFPKIELADIIEGERVIELFWDKPFYQQYYSSFHIYKSDDAGQTWYRHTSIPVNYTAFRDSTKYIFHDSIAQNNVPQYYRIQGLTTYATAGPFSDVITAQAKDRTPPQPPINIRSDYMGNGVMQLSWEVDEADDDIAGFRISRSNEVNQGFIELTASVLPPDTRVFVDSSYNPSTNNYYFIGVFDREGNANVSSPHVAWFPDSIPPEAPEGLRGFVDSSGLITVTWTPNQERDLKGYYVYLSNNQEFTFHNQTQHPQQDTIWQGKIPLNVLTETIHFKVRAIDHRFNASAYSDILTLKKPDLVPPAAPVFAASEVKKDTIMLRWANSQSHDVVLHFLERKDSDSQVFREVYRTSEADVYGVYYDTDILAGKSYEYRITAVDDDGLRSPAVSSVRLASLVNHTLPPVDQLSVTAERNTGKIQLAWKYPTEGDFRFAIYRNLNQQGYSTYKVVQSTTLFTDEPYMDKDDVRFRIKVVDTKGKQSAFSEEVVVVVER